MLFDSPVYFVFLILITAVYWKLGYRAQNRLLLVGSYFFYGWWEWRFLFLMAASTIIDYLIGRAIAASNDVRKRRSLLTVSLVLNFGVLAYFKYLGFFIRSTERLMPSLAAHHLTHTLLAVVLPPAISFYTFQEVAYIVDVYKKRVEPARSLEEYALFISLFPHLIAGPIQRPSHLLGQVQEPRNFDSTKFFRGCMLIVSGILRKCVIADNCATLANAAFAGKLGYGWLPQLIGIYAFAFQIYGDFSGYSDIARGSAQLLGFHFMVNFRQPYFSVSLQEFWRRWHISLSTWLRDYLYIPLGGSRDGEFNTYRNLFLTMLLGGLWHGADWTFVIWGVLHGIGLGLERFFGWANADAAQAMRFQPVRALLVFHFVCLGWIFFRATSMHEAMHYLHGFTQRSDISQAVHFLPTLLVFVVLCLVMDTLMERSGTEYFLQRLSPTWQTAGAAAVLLLAAFASTGQASPFLYFQF